MDPGSVFPCNSQGMLMLLTWGAAWSSSRFSSLTSLVEEHRCSPVTHFSPLLTSYRFSHCHDHTQRAREHFLLNSAPLFYRLGSSQRRRLAFSLHLCPIRLHRENEDRFFF